MMTSIVVEFTILHESFWKEKQDSAWIHDAWTSMNKSIYRVKDANEAERKLQTTTRNNPSP